MRILVVSNTPWDNNNSFGNSFSNIFSGIEGLEFANIFCRYGNPDNDIVSKYFQITEKTLIKNLKNRNYPSGREIEPEESTNLDSKEQKAFDYARKNRSMFFFWARDLVWKIGRWKSKELEKFIDDFKPDVIFQPVYFSGYLNDIALFAKEYTNVPMLGYISDDCYTLRQFRFSPLYWVNRLLKRRKVKATIKKCEILYVISEIQKAEYEKIFKVPCKVLTKCSDFNVNMPLYDKVNPEIKLLYAGNLGKGRVEPLAYLAEAVGWLNKEGFNLVFDIYSATPASEAIRKAFDRKGCCFHGAVSGAIVHKLMIESDIVVHAEGLKLRDRCEVHQSFSTKLVDYFALAKSIFAIGTYDEAFAKHLIDNDAAIVATCKEEVYPKLKEYAVNRNLLKEYGKKAWECGKKHHDKEKIQNMLKEDLKKVIGTNEGRTN